MPDFKRVVWSQLPVRAAGVDPWAAVIAALETTKDTRDEGIELPVPAGRVPAKHGDVVARMVKRRCRGWRLTYRVVGSTLYGRLTPAGLRLLKGDGHGRREDRVEGLQPRPVAGGS